MAPWVQPVYNTDFVALFRWQVSQRPESLAVRSQTRSLTYAQLDELSDAVAANLTAGPDELVGVAMPRSPEMLAALVGVLKRGAAYLPLDQRVPVLRRQRMLEQARPVSVIERLPDGAGRPEPHRAKPHHLAYVLFTSGSTGDPKGVMIERRGLMNNLASKVFDLPLEPGDGVGQTAPLSFDVSVWQLLAPLLAGARVEIMDTTDLPALVEEVVARGVHVLELVPSQLEVLLDELERRRRWLPLRWLIPTGEALPPELCRRWLHLYPDIPMLNAYGPAECADDVTTCIIREPPPEEVTLMPIGTPLPHMQVHLLDENLEPVEEGELCVTGVGVGRGYIGRNSESFLEWRGRWLYRTGDFGRRQPDGSLVFLGRADDQVKIRGERIELGEIEAVVRSHPEVRSVVVTAWERSPGDRVPVAYVVPPGLALTGYLAERLNPAMRPLVVGLERLPLNNSGKVDRAGLPEPSAAPQSDDQVVRIFEELLRLSPLDPSADFFELGGDSLLALRLVARLEERLGVRLSPSQLAAHPTAGSLAALVEQPPAAGRLVCLEEGSGTPLLFLPGAGGHVVYLAPLARRLEMPFYSLEARGLDGLVPPAESIEEEARDVLRALDEVRPRGPYRVAGHSLGAWTALEVALELSARGEEVEFLGLVGMPAPHLVPTYGETLDAAGWLSVISELFACFFSQKLELDLPRLRALAPDEQLDEVGRALKAAGVLPPETDRERMRAILRVYRAHHRISYRPSRRYEGSAALFRTFEEGMRRPVLGWEGYFTRPVTVRFVPGDHLSMMTEPHVAGLAEAMRGELKL